MTLPGRARTLAVTSTVVLALSTVGVTTARAQPLIGAFDGLDRVEASPTVVVTGWASDPASPNPIAVAVSLDGLVAETAMAAGVHPGVGNGHGFDLSLATDAAEHRVCVAAVGAAGSSSTSLGCRIIAAVHPTVPGPPTVPTAVGADASATVAWAAPLSDGGSPVTGYVVTSTPPSQTLALSAISRSVTVSGLSNNQAYRFSVVARNAVGVSAPATSATAYPRPPVPAQSPPPISTSRYIRNINGSSADVPRAYAMGAADAAANPSGHSYLMLLDIGGQTSTGVLLSAVSTFVTYTQLVAAMDAYVDGYASAQRGSAPALIAIGTNNDVDVSATTGAQWASSVINPIAAHTANRTSIHIAGANDIEPGFRANAAESKAWLSGYLGATGSPFVFNGSADGCNSVTYAGGCNNGWAAADLTWLAGAAAPTRIIALPQIYNSTMAYQWKYISLTGLVQNGHQVNFGGPLTEFNACQQAGSCYSLGGATAWSYLWGALWSDSRTAQTSLPYSTDLRIN